MGRKRSEKEINVITKIASKYGGTEIFDMAEKKFALKDDNVWKQISSEINAGGCEIGPLGIYTAVVKNYYNLWEIMEINLEIKSEYELQAVNEEDKISSNSTGSNSNYKSESDENCFNFKCILTAEEYDSLRETTAVYKRQDKSVKKSKHKTIKREFKILEKFNWPQIINRKIFEKEPTIQCNLIFKRAKVFHCGPVYCKIFGRCKECDAVLYGQIIEAPTSRQNVTIEFSITKEFLKEHLLNQKRPLMGRQREEVARKLIIENYSASRLREETANRCMEFGDKEPADLPKLQTLRHVKYEAMKKQQLNSDPILSIHAMKQHQKFSGALHNLGYSPFYIYYWTRSQLHVYRNYCEKNYSRIMIDATGGLVRRIKYPNGTKSQYIFLYQIVVYDRKYKKQYNVASMLSETHSTYAISNWLTYWLQDGAPLPSEVVTDMSLALQYACTKCFTQFSSLHLYLETCYKLLIGQDVEAPTCYLRNDVAHVIKLISR